MATKREKQLFSTQEAAKVLGITDSRVRQLCRAGEIDAIKINPMAWALTKAAIESYSAARAVN